MLRNMMMGVVAAVLSASAADAETVRVYYPEQYCDEIVSQEYSTGGGDSAFQYLEILCRDAEGNYNGFVDEWGSVAGFLGMGRLVIPDRFEYIPSEGSNLRVEN